MTTPRWVGAAFLFVLVVSIAAGSLQEAAAGASSATGAGETAEILAGIAARPTLFRAGLVLELVTAAGILALAALLYAMLREVSRPVALVALAWWLAEGVTLALNQVPGFGLLPLAETMGTPGMLPAGAESAAILAVAGALRGLMDMGFTVHLQFYLLGAVVWFYLFYRGRLIPRWLAIWGLVAESLALVAGAADIMEVPIPVLSFAHLALLELAIGLWLVVRGAPEPSAGAAPARVPSAER